jgi:hypothetical protein
LSVAETSGFIPRVISVLVAIAGVGYLIDSFGNLLYRTYTFELASVTFVGEVVLMIWLLVVAVPRPLSERDASDDHRPARVSDPTFCNSGAGSRS